MPRHNIEKRKIADEQPRALADDVIEGLYRSKKSISARWFYDERGSQLFEEITKLAEYYPTRTERDILLSCMPELSARTVADSVLIEFGSGSSEKTEILLGSMKGIRGYVPIEISESALQAAAKRIAGRFAKLPIVPVATDFCAPVTLPSKFKDSVKIGFFPGSTIGNFRPPDAVQLLVRLGETLGAGGRLIIGVDLQKDVKRLEAAYNDKLGVTAMFNLNVLRRINRELGATFELSEFEHRAFYNIEKSRIEMHLVSRRAQAVKVLGNEFRFEAGETIHTENSYKYTIEGFRKLAAEAGWQRIQTWTDEEQLFSVHELIYCGSHN